MTHTNISNLAYEVSIKCQSDLETAWGRIFSILKIKKCQLLFVKSFITSPFNLSDFDFI